MSKKYLYLGIIFLLCSILGTSLGLSTISCQAAEKAVAELDSSGDEFLEYDEVLVPNDPFEFVNRTIFTFNDALHRWVLEPSAHGYRKVTPNMFRTGLLNFFNNLLEPTRIINSLLQGRFKDAGDNFLRFALNTTAGVGGLMDPATFDGLKSHEWQFASTLAHYGVSSGPYLVLPFFGPSNVRGTFGLVADTLTSPIFYVVQGDPLAALAVQSSNAINRTSFKLGEYEKMLAGALDPYVAMRNAYTQHLHQRLGN